MNRQSTYAYKKDAEASRAKVSGTGVGDIERVKEQVRACPKKHSGHRGRAKQQRGASLLLNLPAPPRSCHGVPSAP